MVKKTLAALFGPRQKPLVWGEPMANGSLCKILRSRAEVNEAVSYLTEHGYLLHPCEPKNWDLAHILPHVGKRGNFLDMGSWESQILANLARRDDFDGELVGIDLQEPSTRMRGVRAVVGDLMDTKLPTGGFRYITCISVIEHGVDFARFAAEASRLLEHGGLLFVTFDYWEPRIVPPRKLYGLEWQPLDRSAVEKLIQDCGRHGLALVEPMEWQSGDAVIREGYHSPEPTLAYTFGLIAFEKRT